MRYFYLLVIAAVSIGCGNAKPTTCGEACAKLPEGKFADIGTSANIPNQIYLSGEDIRISHAGAPAVRWGALVESVGHEYYAAWDGSAWTGLAGSESSGFDVGSSVFGSLRFDANDQPNVSWLGAGYSAAFRRYDGTAWSELAGSATPGVATGNEPVFALDRDDAPIMVWTTNGGNPEIYVRRYDGASWAELAGSASGGGISNTPDGFSSHAAIAVAGNGDVFVAWTESSSGKSSIYVKRYSGGAWSELAGSASGRGISGDVGYASDVQIVAGADSEPVVAWTHSEGDVSEIYMRRFDGSAWQELGGSASGSGISTMGLGSYAGSLSLDGSDNPVVSWTTNLGAAQRMFLRRWDGNAWVELDGSASGDGIGLAQIGNDLGVRHDTLGDQLCVMWTHGDSQSYPAVRVKCMRMP